MMVALAGGVGGARLAVGLAAVLPPPQLTVVVNTGDDFEHLGLSISPDLDTVMYTLAGVNNQAAGWGRKDETWSFMQTLEELDGETWFRLGDRDLAVHVLRTRALARGEPLSEITRTLATRFGVRHAILPMSETPVRTRVRTERGELSFQDYFVRRQCRPRVRGFRFAGIRRGPRSGAAATRAAFGYGACRGDLPFESVRQRCADTGRGRHWRVDRATSVSGDRRLAHRRRRCGERTRGENDARARFQSPARSASCATMVTRWTAGS